MKVGLIIRGRWRSPNHSKDKRLDDSHQIKKEILKEVKSYRKYVVKNPDIDVNSEGKIVLIGAVRGQYKGITLPTDLHIQDFGFVIHLTRLDAKHTEVQLLFPLSFEENLQYESQEIETDFLALSRIYIVPDNDDILDELIKHILITHPEGNHSVFVSVVPDEKS
ncbi:MAG: hypothetical protein AB4040_13190 [Synechococcus sp.]